MIAALFGVAWPVVSFFWGLQFGIRLRDATVSGRVTPFTCTVIFIAFIICMMVISTFLRAVVRTLP